MVTRRSRPCEGVVADQRQAAEPEEDDRAFFSRGIDAGAWGTPQ